ncbi:GntR family transcriptional regulator [Segnochrobactrum spirostomi]|uniref:GntR family transcriptional regulator n=1 Tax=Segnochrobactrum spirostomi TaxID=2608987 RepID=A0A6A7Y5Q7_9HYPH|nr:GntR family transcriptional regulator [Segnochrobactrum spirostomi]MQT14563.1 GntR family transcriptional regulator [Segnochrobactrum spirostomi]
MSEIEPKRAPAVAQQIAEVLIERIVAGVLPPGTPLRQDHVAAEFGASHVPAREALQFLCAQGLAISEPRRGIRVAPMDALHQQEVIEMRAALELLAFRHAAKQFNARHLAAIEAAVTAGEQAGSIVEWERANRDFHAALVAPCPMRRLLAVLGQLRLAHSRIVIAMERSANWLPRSNHEHRQIYAALKARDHLRATTLLTRHLHGIERPGADGQAVEAEAPDAREPRARRDR